MSDGGGDTGGDFGGGGNNDNWNDNNNGYHDNDYYDDHGGGGRSVPALCFIICGTLFAGVGLGAGGFLLSLSMNKKNSYDTSVGEIIGTSLCGTSCNTNSDGSRNCSTTYAAIVEYVVDGITYEHTSNSCSQPAPTIGDEFKILYDPENPGEAVSGSFLALWLAPIILGVFGLIGLCICCCGCFKKRSQSSQDDEDVINDFGEDGVNNTFQASPYETDEK